GPLEHLHGFLVGGGAQVVEELPPPQEPAVGLGAGPRAAQRVLLAAAEEAAQRHGHPAGDLVLDGEDVVEGAVEAVRPALVARAHVDEMHSAAPTDARPAARATPH